MGVLVGRGGRFSNRSSLGFGRGISRGGRFGSRSGFSSRSSLGHRGGIGGRGSLSHRSRGDRRIGGRGFNGRGAVHVHRGRRTGIGREDEVTNGQQGQSVQRTAMTGAAGLAAGMLLSGGKPGKLLGNAMKAGALAAVGGLAYKAWQNHQQSQNNSAPAPAEDAFIPAPMAAPAVLAP